MTGGYFDQVDECIHRRVVSENILIACSLSLVLGFLLVHPGLLLSGTFKGFLFIPHQSQNGGSRYQGASQRSERA
jgi:hypothetical protein